MLVDELQSPCRPESVDVAIVLAQSLEVELMVDVDVVILPPVWRLEGVAQSMQEKVEEEEDEWEEEDLLEEDKGKEALLQKRASKVS